MPLSLRFCASQPIRIVKEIDFVFMDIIIDCESEGRLTQYCGFGMVKFGTGIRDKHPGFAILAEPVPYLNRKFILPTPVEPFRDSTYTPKQKSPDKLIYE